MPGSASPPGHQGYSFTLFAQHALLDALVRNIKPPRVRQMYFALFTDGPYEDGSGTEVAVTRSGSATGYTRMGVAFGSPSDEMDTMTLPTGSICVSTIKVWFPLATAEWGSIVGAALFDAPKGGTMWLYTLLSGGIMINDGDQLYADIGNVKVALD